MPPLAISDLLNPSVETPVDEQDTATSPVDVRPYLTTLAALSANMSAPLYALADIVSWLTSTINQLNVQSQGSHSSVGTPPQHPSSTPSCTTSFSPHHDIFSPSYFPASPNPTVRIGVKLNRITTLSCLYIYEDANAYVEYPETNPGDPVGHLF